MARLIGEAYISLLADASMFKPDADAKLKAASRGLQANVALKADSSDLDKKMTAISAALKTLRGNVPITADTRKAILDIGDVFSALQALKQQAGDIPLDLDNAKAMASLHQVLGNIVALEAEIEKVSRTGIDFNVDKAIAKVYTLRAALETLEAKARHIPVQVTPVITPARGGGTPVEYGNLSRVADTGGGLAAYAAMAKVAGLSSQELDRVMQHLNGTFNDAGVASQLITAGLERMAAGQSMIITKGTGWGAWANQIRLFGGALDKVLPSWARAISLWHLGLDVLFEFAAAWVPAIIAVGTFAAYAAPVAEKIYGQWQNINTVIDGVGGHLTDLGRSFDTVERAIEPGILIAFGEYMQVIGHNAGPMATALAGVGKVVDVWGAALVNWSAKATSAFNNTLHSGTSDFALIGAGFASLFRIIGELIKDMPGIVHVLLPVGDAFLSITANVLKALGPVISFGLLIHGVAVYAGLALTGVVALGRAMATAFAINFTKRTGIALMGEEATVASGKFSKFGATIGAFFGNVVGGTTAVLRWTKAAGAMTAEAGFGAMASEKLAAGFGKLPGVTRLAEGGFKLFGTVMSGVEIASAGVAAGIGGAVIGALVYFAVKTYNAQSAAQKLTKTLDNLIASSTAANFAQNISIALTKTTSALSGTASNFQKLTGSATATSKSLTSLGPALVNPEFGFSALGQKVVQGSANLNEYHSLLNDVIGKAETYGQRMTVLTGIFGNTAGAQAALNLAGISAGTIAKEDNKQWAIQLTELKGLAAGYGYMGQNAGAAAAQLNTLNISSGKTFKNVQALQQAESQWISTVTGGESAFTTFEQGQNTLNSTLKGSSGSAATLTVRLGNLSKTYPTLGAKMSGVSASALAARQAFDQQLSAAATLWGNLQMLSVASGNTAKSQQQLLKAGKDIIAQLLPFAAGSKQATAEVSALAQVMGGPATTNFKTLAAWVGNTKGAEADLNKQQAALTISSINLTNAAKNLGNTLETSVTQAQSAAIAGSVGLTGATQKLANAAVNTRGKLTEAAITAAGQYVSSLHAAGMSTSSATQYLNAYLARLGYAPGVISQLDSALNGNEKNFETQAAKMGISKAAADQLWASLQKLKNSSPYNVNVNETLTGSGKLMAKVSGNSVVIAASGANSSSQSNSSASSAVGHAAAGLGHAAGWMVPAGGTPSGQDGHLAVLAPGELVIPTSHVAPHMAMAKAQGIPGLSGGGLTPGNAAAVGGTANAGVPTIINGALTATANGMSQFATNINSTFQSLQAQVSGIGGKYGGPASFGGGFESLSALVSFAKYFMSQGLNAAAAAGMAATISGEENSLGPESVGSGGFGLIGWTGNSVGLPAGYHGPTGNVAYDLNAQLQGVIGYMNSRGGRGPLNAAGNPIAAGDVWSSYEAPAVRFSDTRPAIANQIYAMLTGGGTAAVQAQKQVAGKLGQVRPHSAGGMVSEPVYGTGAYSGMPYSFAENGRPEYVGPLSGSQGQGGGQMQPMTNVQGQQANNQLQAITKLLQQLPTVLAKALAQGSGGGVRHGFYRAQN